MMSSKKGYERTFGHTRRTFSRRSCVLFCASLTIITLRASTAGAEAGLGDVAEEEAGDLESVSESLWTVAPTLERATVDSPIITIAEHLIKP